MINAKDILTECYVDTAIVSVLLQLSNIYVNARHCHGCNNVAGGMQSADNTFALGIIDNDKRQHSYFKKEFETICKSEHLELLKHNLSQHYLIKVTPAMDQFILDATADCTISPVSFDLPDKLDDFKKLTKSATVQDNKNMARLFKAIKEQNEIKILRGCLSYLYSNKYSANINELKNLFSLE